MSSNDYDINLTNKFKNLSPLNSDLKIHPVIEIAQKNLVVLDPELTLRFHIQEGDLVLQEADGKGIRLVFIDRKVTSLAHTASHTDYD